MHICVAHFCLTVGTIIYSIYILTIEIDNNSVDIVNNSDSEVTVNNWVATVNNWVATVNNSVATRLGSSEQHKYCQFYHNLYY